MTCPGGYRVELTEVISRIVGRHRLLLIVSVRVALVGGLVMHWARRPEYRGTARLVVTSSDARTPSEATAIADTVRALATGPVLVRTALGGLRGLVVSVAAAAALETVRPAVLGRAAK